MKHIIAVFIAITTLMSTTAQAQMYTCPTFTAEQDVLLRKAYAIGDYDDLGYTLAAIVWKESIVGRYIVRINASDGSHGSYGVGSMLLSTAMELTGENNLWRARAHLTDRLIEDEVFALELSLAYLKRHRDLGWRAMITKYNGAGPSAHNYMLDVVDRVKTLQQCLNRRWG